MRAGRTLFTYLHLAASRECTQALLDSGIDAVAYETVQTADGALPLLAPMSEVAGRMAPQVGAHTLERAQGGRGVLMGGVSGVYAAKVVVLGAGVSGMNAAAIALGMQAEVLLLDRNIDKLRSADRIYQGHLQTIASNAYEVERACLDADLVIGAVLVPGAKAPMLVSDDLVAADEAGLGAGGHRRRPGRLLRVVPADHALRPDLPGRRLGVLLRGQHAGRGAAHLDVRADQRDHAVRAGAGQPRAARRRPRVAGAAARASTSSTARSPASRSPRRTGCRGWRWSRRCRFETVRSGPSGRAAGGGRGLPGAPGGRARRGGQHARRVRPGPAALPRRTSAGCDRLGDVSEAQVAGFLAALREGDADHPPLSASSAARAVVAVRGLHRFAARDGIVADDVGPRGPAAGAAPPAAQGDLGRRGRAAAGGGRVRRHPAGAAGPGPAGGALRHRRPDLRGGRARRRRPARPGRGRCCAARAARSGSSRSARTRGRRSTTTSSGPGRRSRPAGGGRRGCSSTPAAARCPGRARGRSCGSRPSGPGWRPRSRRTRCVTRTRPTCSTAARTCGSCRSCSGTRR